MLFIYSFGSLFDIDSTCRRCYIQCKSYRTSRRGLFAVLVCGFGFWGIKHMTQGSKIDTKTTKNLTENNDRDQTERKTRHKKGQIKTGDGTHCSQIFCKPEFCLNIESTYRPALYDWASWFRDGGYPDTHQHEYESQTSGNVQEYPKRCVVPFN